MGATRTIGSAAVNGGAGVSYPGSVIGSWTTIHANLSTTAESAASLRRPATHASVSAFPVKIGTGTRVLVRARYAHGTSTVTASPVVRLYACYGADPSAAGVFADDGTSQFMRIDTATSTVAGVTITLTTTATDDKLRDATYRYSDVTTLDGYDLKGASHLLALTETVANISGGADTVIELQAMLLN